MEDCDAITGLIAASSRVLAAKYYSSEVVEAALKQVLGLDTQLIQDGTYYVVESQETIAGCGGWSFRQTLFGSDTIGDRSNKRLDPERDAARIRAFFVHPDFALQGIGTLVLNHCEQAAKDQGFSRFELGATLSGVSFYRAHGYTAGKAYPYPCSSGVDMEIVPMSKTLGVE